MYCIEFMLHYHKFNGTSLCFRMNITVRKRSKFILISNCYLKFGCSKLEMSPPKQNLLVYWFCFLYSLEPDISCDIELLQIVWRKPAIQIGRRRELWRKLLTCHFPGQQTSKRCVNKRWEIWSSIYTISISCKECNCKY